MIWVRDKTNWCPHSRGRCCCTDGLINQISSIKRRILIRTLMHLSLSWSACKDVNIFHPITFSASLYCLRSFTPSTVKLHLPQPPALPFSPAPQPALCKGIWIFYAFYKTVRRRSILWSGVISSRSEESGLYRRVWIFRFWSEQTRKVLQDFIITPALGRQDRHDGRTSLNCGFNKVFMSSCKHRTDWSADSGLLLIGSCLDPVWLQNTELDQNQLA